MLSLTLSLLFAVVLALPKRQSAVNTTVCKGQTYNYIEQAGYGFLPSASRDKYGDTAGGFGSSAAFDPKSWKSYPNGSYTGTLWAIPDRGWNTNGTLNFQSRVHKFQVVFSPAVTGGPNLELLYEDTILFTDPSGTPTTGLDADADGPYLSFPGFPDLPAATYKGDGFGRNGTGGHRVTIDAEGLVLNPDGTFMVSDEYGPFIYHYDAFGKMIGAIQPPTPYLPMRNNSISYSADSPPIYNPTADPIPAKPKMGRANNQGFEGLTASPDGKYLYVLSQSALDQDGGYQGNPDRRYARMLQYNASSYKVLAEYVVTLPLYNNNTAVAAQSEIHFVSPTQFMVLARDSNAGHGQKSSLSLYRHIDIFDISAATNISGQFTIAPNGTLNAGIVPATYCTWLDYNVNSQLNRFGLHNGGAQDNTLLNEKWESIALVPVSAGNAWGDWQDSNDEYYIFSLSDNDFITQNGYMDFGTFPYKDASGYNLDDQVLVFKVQLPAGSTPRIG